MPINRLKSRLKFIRSKRFKERSNKANKIKIEIVREIFFAKNNFRQKKQKKLNNRTKIEIVI